MTYPTNPTPITLDKERHLRYPLSAVKRIKDKWGKSLEEMLTKPQEDFLPDVIFEGLTDKSGLTPDIIADLLTGPDMDSALLTFIQAFFGQRQRDLIEELDQTRRALLKQTMSATAERILTPTATVQ